MRPSVLLDTGPSGRLVIEAFDGQAMVRAEGELWRPVASLLTLAIRDEEVATALAQQQDLQRGDIVIEPSAPGPQSDAIREAWRGRYEAAVTLCVVRRPEQDARVILPREALADFHSERLVYQDALDKRRARVAARAELLAWVSSLPVDAPLDPERFARIEARIAGDPRAERPEVLLELHALGLLDDSDPDRKRAALAATPTLASLYESALRTLVYLRSDARRSQIDEPPPPILSAGVSIDWFREGPYTAAGLDPDEYLAYREAALLASDDLFDLSPATFYTNDLGPVDTVVYASDNGRTRVLVRSGQRVGGEVANSPLHPDVRLEGAARKCIDAGAFDVALQLLAPLVSRAPDRASARQLLEQARMQTMIPASPERVIRVLTSQDEILSLAEQTDAVFGPAIAALLRQGSAFEQRYMLKRLRPFRSHPDVIEALDELRRSGQSAGLEPHFRMATSGLFTNEPATDLGDRDVPRGTSSAERLFGPEFWVAGVGSALLLISVYALARC